MSSTFCINLDQSKILSCGNGLMQHLSCSAEDFLLQFLCEKAAGSLYGMFCKVIIKGCTSIKTCLYYRNYIETHLILQRYIYKQNSKKERSKGNHSSLNLEIFTLYLPGLFLITGDIGSMFCSMPWRFQTFPNSALLPER